MGLSYIISEIKRDIGRKSRIIHTSPAFDAPVRGGSPSEYLHKVWYGKTTPCPDKKGATDFFAVTFTNIDGFS